MKVSSAQVKYGHLELQIIYKLWTCKYRFVSLLSIALREEERENKMFLLLPPGLEFQGIKEHSGYPEPDPLLKVHAIILTFSVGLSLCKSLFTLPVLVLELKLFQNHNIS